MGGTRVPSPPLQQGSQEPGGSRGAGKRDWPVGQVLISGDLLGGSWKGVD